MVSIIILSYNTKDLLKECLESLFTKLSSVPFEVIVLDNASKDESVSMTRRDFPRVHVIESQVNLGFARGVNLAAKKAKGDYLLFLNSDATLLDANLKKMVSQLEENESLAVIGGNLLNRDETTSEPYGNFYNLPEVFNLLFMAKKAKDQLTGEWSMVDWVSGGYMLVKRKIFAAVKGFDEGFFMYIEDMDLCFRLKKEGFQVVYYAGAKAKHVGQGSSNRTFAVVNIYKGLLYFYKTRMPGWQYFIVRLLLVVKAGSAYSVGVVKNNTYLKTTYSQALSIVL